MIRWLLGVLDDEFIFSGLGLLAVKARPQRPNARMTAESRVIASAESLDEDDYRFDSIPRGGLTEDRIYYVGSSGNISIIDRRGNRDARSNDLRLRDSTGGNLMMVDGIAVPANRRQFRMGL